MKKWFKRFKQDPKGSVSLFFILITAVVFMFNAVLIDYARILAVQQQTEYAVQSGVRSSLAGYSDDLRKYGLFAIEESEAQSIFEKVINDTLIAEQDEETFNYIQPQIEGDINLSGSRSLGGMNTDVLEHQILEEMKYKAPIEIVTNLIDGFSFLSEAMQKASEYTEIAAAIQEDFEKREESLDKAERLLGKDEENIQTKLETFKGQMENETESTYPEVEAFSDIIDHYNTYAQADTRIQDLEDRNEWLDDEIVILLARIVALELRIPVLEEQIEDLEEEIEDLEEKIDDLEDEEDPKVKELNEKKTRLNNRKTNLSTSKQQLENAEQDLDDNEKEYEENEETIKTEKENKESFVENAESTLRSQRELMTDIIDDLKTVRDELETAEDHDTNMSETVKNIENNTEEYYVDSNAHAGEVPEVGSAKMEETIQEMYEDLEEIKKYPYQTGDPETDQSEFFDDVRTPIEEAIAALEDIPDSLEEIEEDLDDTSKQALENLSETIQSAVTEAEEKVKASYEIIDSERKSYERNISKEETQQTEAEEHTESITDDISGWDDLVNDHEAYTELRALFDKYQEHDNTEDDEDEDDEDPDDPDEVDIDSDPSENASSFMSLMNTLFQELGGALAGARNKLYVNEYILLHFESAKPTGLTNAEDYQLENREVEYIIYGLDTPGANYGAALTQLFAIRYAINFVDAFGDPRVTAAAEPLAKFIALMLVALEYTVDDIRIIGSGGKPPFMERMLKNSLLLDYHAYLRLFLFMNPATDNRFQRIAALIEKDTGKDLTKHITYVKGEVTSSHRLLFVPQIAEALSYTGALNGVVDGNRFEFEVEAYFSY